MILAVVGEIDLSDAEEFADEVRSLVGGAEGEVVLSLQNLRFIDSIGIRALYMLARELWTQSQTLVLSGLDGQPRRVLELTGLLDGGGPFEIRDAALSPGKPGRAMQDEFDRWLDELDAGVTKGLAAPRSASAALAT